MRLMFIFKLEYTTVNISNGEREDNFPLFSYTCVCWPSKSASQGDAPHVMWFHDSFSRFPNQTSPSIAMLFSNREKMFFRQILSNINIVCLDQAIAPCNLSKHTLLVSCNEMLVKHENIISNICLVKKWLQSGGKRWLFFLNSIQYYNCQGIDGCGKLTTCVHSFYSFY